MTAPEIYNTFLSISRGLKNKPWKARKDFKDFEKTENGILCVRLELFFKRFPQIDPKEFFSAPYKLYKDEDYFDLKFYLSQKAISCYSSLQKLKLEENPDSDTQIKGILDSIKFVATKLLSNSITFNEYCRQKNGYVYSSVLDYTNNSITLYFLLALPNFDAIFDGMPQQDREIYFKSFHKDIVKFKMRLNNSVKAKNLLNESFKRLNQLDLTQ